MSSLKEIQKQFTQMMFSDENTFKSIRQKYFKNWDDSHALVYRSGILRTYRGKVDAVLFKTKECFDYKYGKKKWDDVFIKFISNTNVNPENFSKQMLSFSNYLPEANFLKELCQYEAIRSYVRFGDFSEKKHLEINGSLHLCSFQYDVPRWYKEWLITDQAQAILDKQESNLQQNEASDEVVTQSQPSNEQLETNFPENAPKFIGSDVKTMVYLMVFRNRKYEVKSIAINGELFSILSRCQNKNIGFEEALLADGKKLTDPGMEHFGQMQKELEKLGVLYASKKNM